MKKKILIVMLTALILLLIPNISNAIDTMQRQLNLYQEVFELVSNYHINNVEPEKLTQGAIKGMLETLEDPYTSYFTAEEYQAFLQDVDGKFTGIGIYIENSDDYIMVQSPIPNSPAEKAGLLSGDLIIEVNGIDIKGMTTEAVAGLIKGEAGTSVILKIKRDGEFLIKEVMRAEIQLPVSESKLLTDDIGYLRLYSFSGQAAIEVNQKMSELEQKNIQSLILDLRGNPGGYLTSALDISKNFLKEGVIAYIKDWEQQEQILSVEGGTNWDKPLIVLIDQGSASASEILAGTLQDYGIATVIGQNSFGKGTIQQLIELDNGGYLKLSFSEYYTPMKNKVNGVGIKPDIEVKDPDEQLVRAVMELTNKGIYYPELGSGWIKDSGKDLISLKSLTNFYNGKITWNSEEKTIVIELKSTQLALPADTAGLKFINGSAYIETDKLEGLFDSLIIVHEQEKIAIFYP